MKYKLVAALFAALTVLQTPVLANNWVNNAPHPASVDPRFRPGGQFSGMVPKFTPDFFSPIRSDQATIPAGTIFSAILEDNLSSSKNKMGDTFALRLQDGFIYEGKTVIPPNSKIIGSVNQAIPSRMLKTGQPGKLDISLQSLVLPDGSHMPIFAFIDSNPNQTPRPPKRHHIGYFVKDNLDSLAMSATSLVIGKGYMMSRLQRGCDFTLDKGEALPVRLTHALQVKMVPATVTRPATEAGVVANPPKPPGMVDPTGPVQIPGLVPLPQSGQQSQQTGLPDDNSIFETPVQSRQPLDNIPDPF
jgi:hypothetical protein